METTVRTSTGDTVPLDAPAVDTLRGRLRGELVRPGDPGYDDARRVWNGMIEKRPGLVVRCAEAGDVAAAVTFAREHELLLAVRGGGHNIAGKSVCDGGLLIDLSPMKEVRVDPERRTARAGAGLKLGELDRETQEFGLATTLGVASDTGISGLTLGGGYGWLAGNYGMACDNLLSAEVVTADGRLLTASPEENDDLFWGIRGAGANFGVVTSLEFQLHAVGPVFGGLVLHPMETAREALRFYHGFTSGAPDEVSTLPAVLAGPDGHPAAGIVACWCGPVEEGEEVLRPLRTFASPLDARLGPMPYVAMQSLLDDFVEPGRLYYWKSSLVRDLSDEAIDTLVERAATMPGTPGSMIFLQRLHGAAGRVEATDTAFPHRYDHYNCGAMAGWDDPAETEANVRWARGSWKALQPFCERSAYVNDLGEEGEERVRAAYGPNYDRLATLKRKYDPTNLFRMNQNVPPA